MSIVSPVPEFPLTPEVNASTDRMLDACDSLDAHEKLSRARTVEADLRGMIKEALGRQDACTLTPEGYAALGKTPPVVVYLAASFTRKQEIRSVMKILRGHGIRCTSRWLNEDNTYVAPDDHEGSQLCALDDLRDIIAANTVVVFTSPKTDHLESHAHLVEFGMGVIFGRRCIVVGRLENVFMHLPQVEHYETIEQFLWEITDGIHQPKCAPREGA
jgi:hypothetical protein